MALFPCKSCGNQVDETAKTCPHCGVSKPVVKKKGWIDYTMYVIAAAFAIWLINPSDEPKSKWLENAENSLTAYYLNQVNYDSVTCKSKEIDKEYFIFCTHPNNRSSGGLYKAEHQGGYDFKVYAINGKAKQHAEKSDFIIEDKSNSTSIDSVIKRFTE